MVFCGLFDVMETKWGPNWTLKDEKWGSLAWKTEKYGLFTFIYFFTQSFLFIS